MSSQPPPPPTSSAPPPPPSLLPQTTGPTATWGADHLDRAPTVEEIKAQAIKQAQAQAEARQAQDVSVTEAVKMIKPADFLGVYQTPCARTGLLSGIGGGAVVGMLRYILGAPVPKAANWAVGAFAAGSIVSYEVCQAARRAERVKMQRVVEVYDRKQAEMKQREADKAKAAAAEAARRQKEEDDRKAAHRWYKFW
ncbi:mitochondrial cytochrome c oxidase protein 20-like protein [Ophiostoma piceae UAMH 11346]|uniref:Cytochrome c oxidase assembly protein COX20, mitochondrial n=1 Tax=Ophiostoma piceae (strain UAMH 11346) TaxID=1262450 RepID=S3CWH9_OPHP1|nr:mitochondrial cytochrome c oxidase protein 20-like protein [Ophiostoma piceae UAMH 11346]